jgi:hypothetical protein
MGSPCGLWLCINYRIELGKSQLYRN